MSTKKTAKTLNVPNLRFPGFEGEWEVKQMGEITSWSSGGTPPKDNPSFWNGDIPWISASSMKGLVYSDSDLKLTQAGLRKGSKLASRGSLLILVRGSMLFNKIPIGIASRDVAFNQDVKSIVINRCSTSEFVLNWFMAFESKILNKVSGTGIGAGKLDLQDLKELEIKIPSLSEQKKITSFLSCINRQIETQNKIIEKLKSLISNSRKELLKRELRFKTADNTDYPDWEEKSLGELLNIGSGKDYKHLKPGTIPVFGTGGLMTYVDSFLYDGETVCIGRKGTIDKPMFYSGKLWTVDTLFYTYRFLNCIPKFMFYIFQSINWLEYNEASGVPSLSKSTIEKIKVFIPSLSEQTKIANFLSALDNKIDLESKLLKQYEEQKKFLLQNLFI